MKYCILQGGAPAAAAVVREVGDYSHHHGALKQLEEQRAVNGVSQIVFTTDGFDSVTESVKQCVCVCNISVWFRLLRRC